MNFNSLMAPNGMMGLFNMFQTDPQMAAQVMAAAGIPPPPAMPEPSVGAALTGDDKTRIDNTIASLEAAPGTGSKPSLTSALSGIKAPEGPPPFHPSAPATAPAPRGGTYQAQGLGIEHILGALLPRVPEIPPYALPSTLGRALGGK